MEFHTQMPGFGSGSGPWLVGRDEACDIVLRDETVDPRHLSIMPLDVGRYRITDMGSAYGTWLHGRRIEVADVSLWDLVRLGARSIRLVELRSEDLGAGRSLVVGRGRTADIVLDHPMVSREHIRISLQGSGLQVEDLGGRNVVTVDGQPVQGSASLPPGGRLVLGPYEVPPEQLDDWNQRLRELEQPGETGQGVPIPLEGQLTLGRSPSADLVLDDPQVSWFHARIHVHDGRWSVQDLGSSNGTFLNGARIRRAPLSPDDALALGPVPLCLDGGLIRRSELDPSELRLDAKALQRVLSNGKQLLDGLSITVFPGELVGVMGPSGAGKTTLLDALTGRARASGGQVLFNHRDLHEHFAQLRHRIGYVPQEDVMHGELTVHEVLLYAALLRLPRDLPRSAVRLQADRLLVRLGLDHLRNQRVGDGRRRGISGGERRRVSIAMELVTEPAMLVLDEPTSGLDATAALETVRALKELAAAGKTVLMTLHQPRSEVFRMLDRLLLLEKGGKLVWFGPAEKDAEAWFAAQSGLERPEAANPADYLLDALEAGGSPEEWQAAYAASKTCQRYVTTWQEASLPPEQAPLPALKGRRRGRLSEYSHLVRRYALRKSRDRGSLAIQLLQAPIIGLLAGWLFHKEPSFGLGLPKLCVLSEVLPALFMLGAAALWFGCSNVARELVGDRPIFTRERLSGLSPTAYLASIFTVQLGIAALQTTVLVAVAWPLAGLAASTCLPAWLLLLVTAACGIGMGLLVSALATSEVAAIAAVPLLLLPQLMFSGYLKLLREMGPLQRAATHLSPMRWIFEGLLGLEYRAAGQPEVLGKCIGFSGSGLLAPLVALSLVCVGLLGATALLIRAGRAPGRSGPR